MNRYIYNPFSKPLKQVTVEDLAELRFVEESWAIDYKREPLKPSQFAKHIAAFANQYGGFLVIGVDEATDKTNVAGTFIGIAKDQVPQTLSNVRDACSKLINPSVFYEHVIIDGPSVNLGLNSENAIVIIGIPRSENTPHIHKSGMVYRRMGDSSLPIAESDRFTLDELWKRGQDYKQRLTKKLAKIPNLPFSQQDDTWVYVFIMPHQLNAGIFNILDFATFTELMKDKENQIGGVKLRIHSTYQKSYSYTASQVVNNMPTAAGVSLHWFHDGTVRFDIPLNKYELKHLARVQSHDQMNFKFKFAAEKAGYSDITVIDYTYLLFAVYGMINMYLQLLKKIPYKGKLLSCFKIKNIFNTYPYLPSDALIEKFENHDMPQVFDIDLAYPENPTLENMIQLSNDEDHKLPADGTSPDLLAPLPLALRITSHIFLSIGINLQEIDVLNLLLTPHKSANEEKK